MKIVCVIFLFTLQTMYAQHIVPLKFCPTWNGETIVLDSVYSLRSGASISLETIRFYISGITFLHDSMIVYKEKNSYHLIDSSDPGTQQLDLELPDNKDINTVNFYLGIDSIMQVSGVMGGDLDPTRGMYWTWQSGYINAKIEGKSSICNTRNHTFQFHLGGYKVPFCSLQKIELTCNNKDIIRIGIDIIKFLEAIELSSLNHIMSPSAASVLLSEHLSRSFYIVER